MRMPGVLLPQGVHDCLKVGPFLGLAVPCRQALPDSDPKIGDRNNGKFIAVFLRIPLCCHYSSILTVIKNVRTGLGYYGRKPCHILLLIVEFVLEDSADAPQNLPSDIHQIRMLPDWRHL